MKPVVIISNKAVADYLIWKFFEMVYNRGVHVGFTMDK